MRRVDEAEAPIERAFELNGNVAGYRDMIVDVYISRGAFDRALAMLAEMPDEGANLLRQAIAWHGAGDIQKSDELIEQMSAEGHDRPVRCGVSLCRTRRE